MGDFGGGGDPLPGQSDVVDRRIGPTREILHRATGQAGADGALDGLGHLGGFIGEAVLQVG